MKNIYLLLLLLARLLQQIDAVAESQQVVLTVEQQQIVVFLFPICLVRLLSHHGLIIRERFLWDAQVSSRRL